MNLQELKEQAIREFEELGYVLGHRSDRFPHTIYDTSNDNLNAFKNWLRTTLDKVAEAAKDEGVKIGLGKDIHHEFEAGKQAAVKEIGRLSLDVLEEHFPKLNYDNPSKSSGNGRGEVMAYRGLLLALLDHPTSTTTTSFGTSGNFGPIGAPPAEGKCCEDCSLRTVVCHDPDCLCHKWEI